MHTFYQKERKNMDETLRFIIGILLFIGVIVYEWMKNRSENSVSKNK
jgi:hypothetical protein